MNLDDMTLRELERESIRAFVASCVFSGVVLDYGCGLQPYRGIVEEQGATYLPFDRASFPANVSGEDVGGLHDRHARAIDAILCTQVVQYVPNVPLLLQDFLRELRPGGELVLTYPTAWPEVEPEDLRRFTKTGMERLLERAGFTIDRHDERAAMTVMDVEFAIGYGVVAHVA